MHLEADRHPNWTSPLPLPPKCVSMRDVRASIRYEQEKAAYEARIAKEGDQT